jgi:hypothetical protein
MEEPSNNDREEEWGIDIKQFDDEDMDQSADESGVASPELGNTTQGQTILWQPLASGVSGLSGLGRKGVQMLRFCGWPIHGAKVVCVGSIEAFRKGTELFLDNAGREVVAQSSSPLGRQQSNSAIQSFLRTSHSLLTGTQLLVTAGFNVVAFPFSKVADTAELLLYLTDAILGSTETSRAIRSMVSFLHQEFRNPATGEPGDKVSTTDLATAILTLLYLQRNSWLLDERENARQGVEDTIWSVIVKDGRRADYPEDQVFEVEGECYVEDGAEIPLEARLRRQLIQMLPEGTEVAVFNETARVITVEIASREPPVFHSFPGVKLLDVKTIEPSQAFKGKEQQKLLSNKKEEVPIIHQLTFVITSNSAPPMPVRMSDESLIKQALASDADDEEDVLTIVSKQSPRRTTEESNSEEGDTRSQPPSRNDVSSRGQHATTPNTSKSSNAATGASAMDGIEVPPMVPPKSPEHTKSPPATKPTQANAKKVRLAHPPRGSPAPNEGVRRTSIQGVPRGGKSDATKRGGMGGIRAALKKGFHIDEPSKQEAGKMKVSQPTSPTPEGNKSSLNRSTGNNNHPPIPPRNTSFIPKRDAPPPPPRRGIDLSLAQPRASNVFNPADTASLSPKSTHLPGHAEVVPAPSERATRLRGASIKRLSLTRLEGLDKVPSSQEGRGSLELPVPRARPLTPSIYTLKTSDSQSDILMSDDDIQGDYDSGDGRERLRRSGVLTGMFPSGHLLDNLARYMRFSSAAYGRIFLKTFGIAKYMPLPQDDTSEEIFSFAHHTGIASQDVVVTSFVDAKGGPDSTGSMSRTLIHYIAIDHDKQAVVLACRGTLGFDDVLADMACEYDDLVWDDSTYKVHKGMHASATRLLYGEDGRILASLRDTLRRYPAYGLVLCGHSLGGGVTALLGVMLSRPDPQGQGFVTSGEPLKVLGNGQPIDSEFAPVTLPAGRPIHVYAYGPPGTMSPRLRLRTRGLITSVVNNDDIVPCLSLGILHDLQSVALARKSDNASAVADFWERVKSTMQSSFNNSIPWGAQTFAPDDEWAFMQLKMLRSNMLSHKLLPPGSVLVLKTEEALKRVKGEAERSVVVDGVQSIKLKHVRNVEVRFREIRFTKGSLPDHNPANYETALETLRKAVAWMPGF